MRIHISCLSHWSASRDWISTSHKSASLSKICSRATDNPFLFRRSQETIAFYIGTRWPQSKATFNTIPFVVFQVCDAASVWAHPARLTGIVRSQFVYFAKRVFFTAAPTPECLLRGWLDWKYGCDQEQQISMQNCKRNVYCPIHPNVPQRHGWATCCAGVQGTTLRKLRHSLQNHIFFRLCLTNTCDIVLMIGKCGVNAKCFLVYKKRFLSAFLKCS